MSGLEQYYIFPFKKLPYEGKRFFRSEGSYDIDFSLRNHPLNFGARISLRIDYGNIDIQTAEMTIGRFIGVTIALASRQHESFKILATLVGASAGNRD